jgi:hypothetical protein
LHSLLVCGPCCESIDINHASERLPENDYVL